MTFPKVMYRLMPDFNLPLPEDLVLVGYTCFPFSTILVGFRNCDIAVLPVDCLRSFCALYDLYFVLANVIEETRLRI